MAEALLKCNVQICRKKLEDEALATSCSHIFCAEHGQEVIRSKSCLACGTKCKSKFDYAVNNLQPTDQYKSINQESEMKEQTIKKSMEEKEEMQSYCNTMATNYKAEIEKLKKSAQTLRTELEEKIKETEKQREYIANCSRINKRLQLDTYKRQILSLKGKNAYADIGTTSQQTPSGGNLDRNLQFNFSPAAGMFGTAWPNSRHSH